MKTAKGVTLIRNGQLVDGTGTLAIPDAALLIRDGVTDWPKTNASPPYPPKPLVSTGFLTDS